MPTRAPPFSLRYHELVDDVVDDVTDVGVQLQAGHKAARGSGGSTGGGSGGGVGGFVLPSSSELATVSLYGAVNVIMAVPSMYGYAAVIFRDPAYAADMPSLAKLVCFSSAVHQVSGMQAGGRYQCRRWEP